MVAVQAFVHAAIFGLLALYQAIRLFWRDVELAVPVTYAAAFVALSLGFAVAGVLAMRRELRWPLVLCWVFALLLSFLTSFSLFVAAYLVAGLAGAMVLPFRLEKFDLFSLGRPDWADQDRRRDP
jgi:hypothetical protein